MSTEDEWKPDICVYHGGCDDGFGAAWAVHKKWGDSVRFVAGAYGGFEWPADIAGKNILFVDFSLKGDQMIQLSNGGNTGAVPRSIVVLDHHKTAEAELKDWSVAGLTLAETPTFVGLNMQEMHEQIVALFDMDRSGARLAWEFCFPGNPVPMLIEHIEDRDLWRFRLATTKTVSAALRTYPQDFATWDSLDVDTLRDEGRAILRGHERNVADMIRNRYWTDVGGVRVPVLNVPYHYASDCADAILDAEPGAPFAATWFRRADGKEQFSLRSRNERMDVSEIAKKFGGGGHRNAAGFERPETKARRKRNKELYGSW